MPIDAEWKSLYPADWDAISLAVREDAGWVCEWCDVAQGAKIKRPGDKTTIVVLTVAHLDHDPRHCDRENLRALCQKCHINYDKRPGQQRKREMLRAEVLHGQTSMFGEGA
jgi:5-methylcytosine-specific restriction endonuclease McrA